MPRVATADGGSTLKGVAKGYQVILIDSCNNATPYFLATLASKLFRSKTTSND